MKYGQYYKPAITAAKGVSTWPVWLTAILAIMPTSLEELQQNWPAVLVLLVATVQPMAQNWWKHSDKPLVPLWVILAPLLGALVAGCATTTVDLVQTLPSTNPEFEGERLEYHYKDSTPPFAEKKALAGALYVKVGADGAYTITANAEAAGVDNSGQIAGIAAIGQTFISPFAPMINAASQALINRNPPSAPGLTTETPDE